MSKVFDELSLFFATPPCKHALNADRDASRRPLRPLNGHSTCSFSTGTYAAYAAPNLVCGDGRPRVKAANRLIIFSAFASEEYIVAGLAPGTGDCNATPLLPREDFPRVARVATVLRDARNYATRLRVQRVETRDRRSSFAALLRCGVPPACALQWAAPREYDASNASSGAPAAAKRNH